MQKAHKGKKFHFVDKKEHDGQESIFAVNKRKRKKRDAVERALNDVKELAKLAVSDDEEGLPYGHKGWIRKKDAQRVPIPEERLQRYNRGDGLSEINQGNKKLRVKEKEIQFSIEQAARAEILLTEESGFLETEDEDTTQITQTQIANSVDILSASKHFDLYLEQFGPYRINYTRNGKYLLLGGRKGHIATFDWITKHLLCEINVMEEIFDVQWFHNELFFAVAQKKWLYIYDNQGIELHCVKNLPNILRMDFLPYHFLLTCCSSVGFLSWLDVSMGKMVASFPATYGHRLNLMAQNPYNALVCLGHYEGSVTMWSPNSQKPLVRMLCHTRPLQAIAINRSGMYMATSAVDNFVRIWDLRQLKGPLQDYRMRFGASNLAFSDKSLLAVSLGNVVEVYRDCCEISTDHAYLRHKIKRRVEDIQFCPFEDILGIGSGTGFTSMIVPGAGEANFDALDANPFQTKEQRREAEVKALLEKIQPEHITLDPYSIGDVNVPTLQEKLEAKQTIMVGSLPRIDFTPRRKGRNKAVQATKAKKIVRENSRREMVSALKEAKEHLQKEAGALQEEPQEEKPYSVLNRFLPKKKK